MPALSGEHVSSSSTTPHPVEFQCSTSQDSTRCRSPAAAKPLSPSQLNNISQKAESQLIRDGPWPTAAHLGRVFSISRMGTNTNKSREIIPVIPTRRDGIVSSRTKRLSRNPSRRLLSASVPAQTSPSQHATPFTSTLPPLPPMCGTDVTPKRPTNNNSSSPAISVEDETDEETDDLAVHDQKIRQLQMARLAKLTRHLGEEIPPELVLSSTISTDRAESSCLTRNLSIKLSKDHQRRRSLNLTADLQPAPSLCMGGTSLRGTEDVLRLQTYGQCTVSVADGKLPYALHPPGAEADFHKHSQPYIAASLSGFDDVDNSLMSAPEASCSSHNSLHPPPRTSSLTSTLERSQFRGNPLTAESALHNISNMEPREEKLDNFLGVDIKPEPISLKNRSLHHNHTSVAVGIHPSITQIPSYSEPEVDVRISKRTRFWRMKVRKDMVQSVDPDDISKQLRQMKASIS